MGAVISRFRAKRTTKETLEEIEAEIQSILDNKYRKSRQQKKWMTLILFSSVLIYILVAVVCYYIYLPSSQTWAQSILYSLPLVIFPFISWFLRQMIQWYYRWVIDTQEDRLHELKKEKKRVLDRVMDTETYKAARELFQLFDPARLRDKDSADQTDHSKSIFNPNAAGLRYRPRSQGPATAGVSGAPVQQQMSAMNNMAGRVPPVMGGPSPVMQRSLPPNAQSPGGMRPAPYPYGAPRLARPILPQDRGMMDKIVDFVVGDGPANRYALVCRVCSSHNGMALKEEFEYLAFRCCYCMQVNPARKQRPHAPRLATAEPPPSRGSSVSDVSTIAGAPSGAEVSQRPSAVSPSAGTPQHKAPNVITQTSTHSGGGGGGSHGSRGPGSSQGAPTETDSELELIDADPDEGDTTGTAMPQNVDEDNSMTATRSDSSATSAFKSDQPDQRRPSSEE